MAASALTVIRLVLLVGSAAIHRRRARRRPPSVRHGPGYLPDVAVVIPAYNEAAGIARTIRSMVTSRYRGRIEVIVVDDGSVDGTATIARSLRIPYVRVISQPNSGKPGALNRGIAEARSDILILVDGDTIFQADTIGRLVAPLASRGRRRGQRQHQGRQPPRVPRRLAAPRVRHGIQPGPTPVRPARHDPHRAGRDRRLPAGRARRGGRGQHRHARRGHRPDNGPVPVALARRLRARRHRLDRGAVQPAPALAAALPVVLRHHAGHVEEPARGHRARAIRQVRPVLPTPT